MKDAFILSKGLFGDKEIRKKGVLLIFFSIVCELGLVYCQYLVSYWNNDFYNALQRVDGSALYRALMQFSMLIGSLLVIIALRYTFQSKLAITWREYMTRHYLDQWIDLKAFYGMELISESDNPDQRISEDINAFVTITISLFLGLFNSLLTLVSFIGMLWTLSGITHFSIWGVEVSISGYLVWSALIYSTLGTVITYFIGGKLSKLDYLKEKKEAHFRFSLMRLRESAESIAISSGGHYEKTGLYSAFTNIKNNFYDIIQVTRKLNVWNTFYANLSNIAPIIIALPKFLASEIQIGGLMQISSAFGQITGSLSFLISSFATIASYKAVVIRLKELSCNIASWNDKMMQQSHNISYDAQPSIILRNVSINLPNERNLLSGVNLSFDYGKSYLITGRNGVGKSTLLKSLSGSWPFTCGEIILPKAKILFLPQTIYFPSGSLQDAISYPSHQAMNIEMIKHIMHLLGIPYLIERLTTNAVWSNVLSVGEQQKIGIVRALYAQPDFLIMDESTSALTADDEILAMDAITSFLPKACIISVGHRDALKRYHQCEVYL